MYGGRFLTSKMEAWSAQRLDVKLRAAGGRPASSGAPLAAHPIMPVQVARRRANSRRGSRLGLREKRRRTVNFNDELGGKPIFSNAQQTPRDGLAPSKAHLYRCARPDPCMPLLKHCGRSNSQIGLARQI